MKGGWVSGMSRGRGRQTWDTSLCFPPLAGLGLDSIFVDPAPRFGLHPFSTAPLAIIISISGTPEISQIRIFRISGLRG